MATDAERLATLEAQYKTLMDERRREIDNLKESYQDNIANLKESIENSRAAMEKRLEGMNEFRNQLKDQTSTFITRAEYSAHVNNNEVSISQIDKILSKMEGKADAGSMYLAMAFSFIGMLLGAIGLLLRFFKP